MAAVFDAAAAVVLAAHPGDGRATMFRAPALRTSGRCYAFSSGDGVIAKLPAARVAELIAAGTGTACHPSGKGRPMREWVRLAPDSVPACVDHLLEARAFVACAAR